MKVAILADTHFGIRAENPALAQATSKFFSEVFYPECRKRGVTRAFHLGDLFDRRKYVNFLTADQCYNDFIRPAVEARMTIHLSVGNHDTYYRDTNRVNSPEVIYGELVSNLMVHTGPTHVPFGSGQALMVPWVCRENAEETFRALKESPSAVILGHLELNGFEMHRGQLSTKGMSSSLFDRFSTVLSGHFHTRSRQGNIEYVGSTCQFTWADYEDPRGFHVMDTETHELEFVMNPFEPFCKIHYDDKTSTPEELMTRIEGVETDGKFVKLIVREKTDLFLFDRAVDALEKRGVIDLQVVDDHRHADEVVIDSSVLEAGDTLDTIVGYVESSGKAQSLPPGVLETAVELTRKLYEEAQQK